MKDAMIIAKKYPIICTFLCLMSSILYSQNIVKITSTGRTTGHIATLYVSNPSSQPVSFKLGNAIIPSKEFETAEGIQSSQPQIHTGNIEQEIAPGTTAEIPVDGYCLDVGKPPLPAGELFPPFDGWVMAVPTSPEPINPGAGSGAGTEKPKNAIPTSPEPVNPGIPRPIILNDLPTAFKPKGIGEGVPVPPGELNPVGPNATDWGLTYPGSDKPFDYTIDISEHPKDAAIIIFPIVEKITIAYEELQKNEEIQTPFSYDEKRQREAVIQQALWMATSLLQGQEYGKEEFANRMENQFEEASGVKIDKAPEKQQEQFNQGVEQFWGTFELVGEKAKVIKKNVQQHQSKNNDDSTSCCDRIRSRLRNSLLFYLNDAQYIEIDGATVKFSVKKEDEWITEELNFDFDIQAAFCSLGDNEVLGRLTQTQIATHTLDEDGETVEVEGVNTDDVIMGSPTNQADSRDAFVMRIMNQTINNNDINRELSIAVSIDKNTCEVMVQLHYAGEIYEHRYVPN